MFKLARPRYVIKEFAGKKFPIKPRSEIKDTDITDKFDTPKIVDKKTNITTLGSCFAQRLRDWLISNNFNYKDGKWDRVYSPRNIKQTIQTPSRIMVLEFPKSVTLQSLRSAVRIDTEIKVKVKVDDEFWQATITDLSINGCHLEINNGEALVLADNKMIAIVIEDFQGLQNINLSAAICNIKQESNGATLGVQFTPDSKKQVTGLLHHAVTLED